MKTEINFVENNANATTFAKILPLRGQECNLSVTAQKSKKTRFSSQRGTKSAAPDFYFYFDKTGVHIMVLSMRIRSQMCVLYSQFVTKRGTKFAGFLGR